GGSLHFIGPGIGANTATWQTSGLAAGSYDVQLTWVAQGNRASNATYQIYDGSTLRKTVTVNQQLTPVGVVFNNWPFQSTGIVSISSGTLKVVLSDQANGYVIADAVRILPAAAPTIDLNWAAGGLTGPATATVQTPFTLNRDRKSVV